MTECRRPLRLLSLDGGGIRGLSILYILRSLMKAIAHKAGLDPSSPLRPCEYFDLIAGTSTGGLIAIMLGTLRMDIQTCIDEYLKMAPEIFPVEGLLKGSGLARFYTVARSQQRFDAQPLESAVKRCVVEHLGQSSTAGEETLFRFEASKHRTDSSCKVLVCVTSEKLGKHFRFRSYDSPWDDLDDCPIWQACRATSAAPTFFPPIEIGNPPIAYVDGALGYNNPIRALMDETSHIWPSERRNLGCIVSIGTGVLISRDVGRAIKPLFDKIKEMATDTEKVAREFEEEIKSKHGIEQKLYFRFNVQHGLEHIGLEEWKEMDRTKVATQDYVKGCWSRIDTCASKIVDIQAPALVHDSDEVKKKTYIPTEEEVKCRQSLLPQGIDYESQKNQNPKRVPNTCLWTLQNPKYIGWRDDATKKLLWISANPGCGKSVLARCIIDEDLPEFLQKNPSYHVLYYFFKDTSPEQRSAPRAVATVLSQLFKLQPYLIRHAIPEYRDLGEQLKSSLGKLWSIFKTATEDPLAKSLICIFDALDECDESQQLELIKGLENICLRPKATSSTSTLKFIITSRPYFQIRREFDELLQAADNIELTGNEESATIEKEINLVIRDRVAVLASRNRLDKRVSDHLEKKLLQTEHRTYLWLRLIWLIIERELSGNIPQMNDLIDNLPSDVSDSYEELLRRCPKPEFARKVLQIVLVARRPLTLEEIDFALNVNEQTSSYADLHLEGNTRIQEVLPSRCGLMITIIKSRVYFIHQTVKEFLISNHGAKPPPGRIWQGSLDPKRSHQLLTMICLQTVNFPEAQKYDVDLCNALLPEHDRELERWLHAASHVFLSYCAMFWADHFRDQDSDYGIEKIKSFVKRSSHVRFKAIRPKFQWFTSERTTLLSAASASGLEKIVLILLEHNKFDVNLSDNYGPPLVQASKVGHEQAVRLLLANPAIDVNASYSAYSTPLIEASREGHERIVQLLLTHPAIDVNASFGSFNTPLLVASREGHERIVQLLLAHPAIDVNASYGSFNSPIIVASKGGHERVVQLLFTHPAIDLTASNLQGVFSLRAAAEGGYERIVQLLLTHPSIDFNASESIRVTSVVAASRYGNEEGVRSLLNHDSFLAALSGTPLARSAALENDRTDIAQMPFEKRSKWD